MPYVFLCLRHHKLKTIVYGIDVAHVGGITSNLKVMLTTNVPNCGKPPRITGNILKEECEKLTEDFKVNYLKTMLSYVLYDATIQGSFLNTNSPVAFYVMPLKFNLEIGFRYSLNRFNYGYTICYHTKKNVKVKNSNIYGSFQISYLFN